MKTISNLISWAALIVLAVIIALISLALGAYCANTAHDVLHLRGFAENFCVALPVFLFVSLSVTLFLLCGLRKFQSLK